MNVLHTIIGTARPGRKRSAMDWLMIVLFSIMFVGVGVLLIVVGTREWLQQRSLVSHAVAIEAKILEVDVTESTSADTDPRLLRDNSTTSYSPRVRFEYALAGTRYESQMLYPTIIERGYASRESAFEEVRSYVPGATTTAFVNTNLPDKAFLRLEASSNPIWFIVGGTLSILLLMVLVRFL